MKYDHLQINKIGIAGALISTLIAVFSVYYEDYDKYAPQWLDTSSWNIFGVAIVVGILLFALNMMVLRTRVSKSELMWHFGIGLPYKKLAIADIDTIEVVRNKWWYGWGIRKIITGAWLYNVYGLDAIEITTHKGKRIRLGTDEPKKLYRVLNSVLDKDDGEVADG